MGGTYSPQSLGITAPAGGFQQGGWYSGRQFYNGTLSDAGVIHPQSNQQGAGQAVSAEVNAQSAAQQGVSPDAFNKYLQTQQQKSVGVAPVQPAAPASNGTALTPTGGPTTASGAGSIAPPPTLDLQGLYQKLYDTAGVGDIEANLTSAEKSFNDAQSTINNNPFLSEGNRVGRIQKLQTDYNNNTKGMRDDLATKKADIESQIGIATKQFDINSTAAKDALSQFNNLLSMGALDNASGQDIASITKATGLSSSMIQNAINSHSQSGVKPQVITSTDNSGNVTVTTIDQRTGKIINEQSLGGIGTSKKASMTAQTAETKGDFNTDLGKYYSNAQVTYKGKTGPAQTVVSPEDFYKLLIQQYPQLSATIPNPKAIRKVTGQ